MDARAFQAATGVSRETMARLQIYADLLVKWQTAINLVGPKTLPDLWSRHFLDSAQLFPLLPPGTRTLVDLGSGAGFPGLVLAIMGVPDVHLVESDARKGTFMREVARETGAKATVHTARIEQAAAFPADVVTARALAPLDTLFGYAERFWGPATVGFFLKGEAVEGELTAATESWTFATERIASRSDAAGVVLRVTDLRRGGVERRG